MQVVLASSIVSLHVVFNIARWMMVSFIIVYVNISMKMYVATWSWKTKFDLSPPETDKARSHVRSVGG